MSCHRSGLTDLRPPMAVLQRACPLGSYTVMPPRWSYRPQATNGGLTECMPARVIQRHATGVVLQTSGHQWWSYRELAREGLAASCQRSGLTDLRPPKLVLLRACPRGSYSVMPPKWSYGPLVTNGGLTEIMPACKSYSDMPPEWSYRPLATNGGLIENPRKG